MPPLGNAARAEVGRLEDGRATPKPTHVSADSALALRKRRLAFVKSRRLRSRFLLEAAFDANQMAWDALVAYEDALKDLLEVTEPTEGTQAGQQEVIVPATKGQRDSAPPATTAANDTDLRHHLIQIAHIVVLAYIIFLLNSPRAGSSGQIEGSDATQQLRFLALPAA